MGGQYEKSRPSATTFCIDHHGKNIYEKTIKDKPHQATHQNLQKRYRLADSQNLRVEKCGSTRGILCDAENPPIPSTLPTVMKYKVRTCASVRQQPSINKHKLTVVQSQLSSSPSRPSQILSFTAGASRRMFSTAGRNRKRWTGRATAYMKEDGRREGGQVSKFRVPLSRHLLEKWLEIRFPWVTKKSIYCKK